MVRALKAWQAEREFPKATGWRRLGTGTLQIVRTGRSGRDRILQELAPEEWDFVRWEPGA